MFHVSFMILVFIYLYRRLPFQSTWFTAWCHDVQS